MQIKKPSKGFAAFLVVWGVGVASATAAIASTGAPANDEPPGARQVGEARKFAEGITTQGRPWRSITYLNGRGDVCMDIFQTVSGQEQSAGTCFAADAQFLQTAYVKLAGDVVLLGQMAEAERNAPGDLRIDLSDGSIVTVPLGEQGLYAVPVAADPLTIRSDIGGAASLRPYFSGDPSRP